MSDLPEASPADLQSDGLVLVDFWAPWCAPCARIKPLLVRLSADVGARLKVVAVNVDDQPALATEHAVTSVPTLLLLDSGEPVWRTSGALPYPMLHAQVSAHLR